MQRILVPIDGTESSWRAFEYAVNMAQCSGGSLVIMTVTSDSARPVPAVVDGHYAKIGNSVLDAARTFLEDKPLDCTYLLEHDFDVAERILQAVEDECCDAVVIGSRGLGAVEGFLKNSISRTIVEDAPVPVTVVK